MVHLAVKAEAPGSRHGRGDVRDLLHGLGSGKDDSVQDGRVIRFW